MSMRSEKPGLLCECGCRQELPIGSNEYERAAKKGLVVIAQHAYTAGRVIELNALYAIVEEIGEEADDAEACARCDHALTPADTEGLCLHCRWVVRGEIEVGLRELTDYLAAWTKFEQWCAERGMAA